MAWALLILAIAALDASAQVPEWRLGSSPAVSVGDGAGEGQELFDVRDATRLPDGSLAVLDAGSDEVRIFSRDGRLRKTLGGTGEGPGEFQGPTSMRVIAPDALLVYDRAGGRMTAFTLDGDVLETRRLLYDISSSVPVQGHPRPMASGLMPIVRIDIQIFTAVRRPDGLHEKDSLVFMVHDGEEVRPIARRPMHARYTAKDGQNGVTMAPPFGEEPIWAVGPSEFVTGTSHGVDFRGFDSKGSPTTSWTALGAPRKPTRGDWAAFEDAYRDEGSTDVRIRGRVMSSGRARDFFLEQAPRGDRVPLFDTAYLSDDRTLWLREYVLGSSTATWQVVAPGGTTIARIEMPADATLFEAGSDYVLLRERDELDVPIVREYPLIK